MFLIVYYIGDYVSPPDIEIPFVIYLIFSMIIK